LPNAIFEIGFVQEKTILTVKCSWRYRNLHPRLYAGRIEEIFTAVNICVQKAEKTVLRKIRLLKSKLWLR